ncbi:MAG: ABC transporter C-terminal domain-containing protein [Roseiflexaceae bacterium]
MAALEAEKNDITSALSGVETDPKRIAALAARYSEIERTLLTRYDEWAALTV